MLKLIPPVASSLMFAAVLLLPSFASAVTIDWVTIGDPGNAADAAGIGAVATSYRISKTEVTNAQYAEFLNAKAASDPFALYQVGMGVVTFAGGITRSGSSGSYTYTTIVGRENMPVNNVSFFDALRFANWLHNGQGSGDTETGAYTLLGGTIFPSNGSTLTRNPGATIYLTSEDEWHKAAYFDGTSYFSYPAGTNTETVCTSPGTAANTANCGDLAGDVTEVGSYTGSASPYGTFDQAGNVGEWTEDMVLSSSRVIRGGPWAGPPTFNAASFRSGIIPSFESNLIGFRVASVVPEPCTGIFMLTGVLGLLSSNRGK